MKYYIHVIKNYAIFTGRARRSEYWYFVLFNFLFAIAASVLDHALGLTFNLGTASLYSYGYIYALYVLFTFLPSLAVLVRRLHDVGKSGWFFFIVLIPLAGAIWLLVLLFTDSKPGENKWGPNPKGIGNFDEIDQIGSDMQTQ